MNKDKALFRLEREKLLLTGEIPRLFMKYALPGVAGLLFLGIQSVIDGIVLGRFVGANALASVNLDFGICNRDGYRGANPRQYQPRKRG